MLDMNSVRFVAGLVSVAATALFAQVTRQPSRTIIVPDAPESIAEAMPLAAGNHLMRYRMYSQTPDNSKIRLMNLDSKVWRELNPWPADPTAAVYIKKVLPFEDGRVFVGLRAISPDNQRAEIMAVYDPAGKLAHSFRTNPFAWNDFAVDKDGSIWMFGNCPDYLAAQCGPTYSTVRHYSIEGQELIAFLPLESCPGDPLGLERITVANTLIFTPGERIAIYSGATEELLQFNRQGKLVTREKLNFPEDVHVVRLIMTPGGRLFLAWDTYIREWNFQTRTFEERSDLKGGWLSAIENEKAILTSFRIGESTTVKYFDLR